MGSIIFIIGFILLPMMIYCFKWEDDNAIKEKEQYIKEQEELKRKKEEEKRELERKKEEEKREQKMKIYNNLLEGNCEKEYQELKGYFSIRYYEDEKYIYFKSHYAYGKYFLFRFYREEGKQIALKDIVLISYCYSGVYDGMPLFDCTLIRNLTVQEKMRTPNLNGLKVTTTSQTKTRSHSYRITKRF